MINAERKKFLNILEGIFTFILSWVSCGSSKYVNHIKETLVLYNYNSPSSIKNCNKTNIMLRVTKSKYTKPTL